ncbi:MAG: type IV pilus twitching motility protein PilT [Candidatus Woesearchaeota archaeon]
MSENTKTNLKIPTAEELLELTISRGSSDLHLIVGCNPMLRIDGNLIALTDYPILDDNMAEKIITSMLTKEQIETLVREKELDVSIALEDEGRFRVNVFYQRGSMGAALRLIPNSIKTLEELGMPKAVEKFTEHSQGFVLVTGPTGHGKSTTLASMIDKINSEKQVHIITIEDPIEYMHESKRAIVDQRELHLDTKSWSIALKSALREDPDVVLVGEMRDLETIAAAITIAETGHLVFTTLHTNSAAQTIDRIIDVFPARQQPQIRMQLAASLTGVVSQRLIPRIGGGRIVAAEIMTATPAVRNAIREGKTHQLNNIIEVSAQEGMISMDRSLASLVKKGEVIMEDAKRFAINPSEFDKLIR